MQDMVLTDEQEEKGVPTESTVPGSEHVVGGSETIVESMDCDIQDQVEGSFTEGGEGEEGGSCNGDDIMVEVLGSHVYVDGICTTDGGGGFGGDSNDKAVPGSRRSSSLEGEATYGGASVMNDENLEGEATGGGHRAKGVIEGDGERQNFHEDNFGKDAQSGGEKDDGRGDANKVETTSTLNSKQASMDETAAGVMEKDADGNLKSLDAEAQVAVEGETTKESISSEVKDSISLSQQTKSAGHLLNSKVLPTSELDQWFNRGKYFDHSMDYDIAQVNPNQKIEMRNQGADAEYQQVKGDAQSSGAENHDNISPDIHEAATGNDQDLKDNERPGTGESLDQSMTSGSALVDPVAMDAMEVEKLVTDAQNPSLNVEAAGGGNEILSDGGEVACMDDRELDPELKSGKCTGKSAEQASLWQGQPMEVEEYSPDSEKASNSEEKNVKWTAMEPGILGTVQQAKYQLPAEDESEFSVSDLVWGKVRSHPWWPGQIFDPSDASEKAMKYHKKESFLVAYFGDRTFAWNEASLLKPFRTHFSQIEKQSNLEAFQNAVDCALKEISWQVEWGLACSCIPKDVYEKIRFQKVENAGVQEGLKDGSDRSLSSKSFDPNKFVDYIKALAESASVGGDRLDLVIAKAQLLAFYRLQGYHQLPEFQLCGWLLESDSVPEEKIEFGEAIKHVTPMDDDDGKVSSGQEISQPQRTSYLKRKHNLKDGMYPSKKERSLSELMGDAFDSLDGENGLDGKADGKMASASSGKKRKVVDSPVSSPKPSFKIGECIRRAASQMTGSPSILRGSGERLEKLEGGSDSPAGDGVDVPVEDDGDAFRKRVINPSEYSSLDALLSQLQIAACDPLADYSFPNIAISFFSDFRNSAVLDRLPVDTTGGTRKFFSAIFGSETFEFEDMNDTYWTDRIVQNGSEEQPSHKGQYQIVTVELDKSLHKSRKSRKRYSDGNLDLAAGKPPGYVSENAPAEIVMSFSNVNSIPPETKLNKMFRHFGPLKESETEIDRETSRARVVFKKCSDAEVAFNSAGKFNIFGTVVVNYQLNYFISESFKASLYAPTLAEETQLMATTLGEHTPFIAASLGEGGHLIGQTLGEEASFMVSHLGEETLSMPAPLTEETLHLATSLGERTSPAVPTFAEEAMFSAPTFGGENFPIVTTMYEETLPSVQILGRETLTVCTTTTIYEETSTVVTTIGQETAKIATTVGDDKSTVPANAGEGTLNVATTVGDETSIDAATVDEGTSIVVTTSDREMLTSTTPLDRESLTVATTSGDGTSTFAEVADDISTVPVALGEKTSSVATTLDQGVSAFAATLGEETSTVVSDLGVETSSIVTSLDEKASAVAATVCEETSTVASSLDKETLTVVSAIGCETSRLLEEKTTTVATAMPEESSTVATTLDEKTSTVVTTGETSNVTTTLVEGAATFSSTLGEDSVTVPTTLSEETLTVATTMGQQAATVATTLSEETETAATTLGVETETAATTLGVETETAATTLGVETETVATTLGGQTVTEVGPNMETATVASTICEETLPATPVLGEETSTVAVDEEKRTSADTPGTENSPTDVTRAEETVT